MSFCTTLTLLANVQTRSFTRLEVDNCGPQAKYTLLPIFVNKIFLEHRYLFVYLVSTAASALWWQSRVAAREHMGCNIQTVLSGHLQLVDSCIRWLKLIIWFQSGWRDSTQNILSFYWSEGRDRERKIASFLLRTVYFWTWHFTMNILKLNIWDTWAAPYPGNPLSLLKTEPLGVGRLRLDSASISHFTSSNGPFVFSLYRTSPFPSLSACNQSSNPMNFIS